MDHPDFGTCSTDKINNFKRKIVNAFLPIGSNLCFG